MRVFSPSPPWRPYRSILVVIVIVLTLQLCINEYFTLLPPPVSLFPLVDVSGLSSRHLSSDRRFLDGSTSLIGAEDLDDDGVDETILTQVRGR